MDFYKGLLGSTSHVFDVVKDDRIQRLVKKVLPDSRILEMRKDVSDAQI